MALLATMKVLTLSLLLLFVGSRAVEMEEKDSIRLFQDLGLSEESLDELLSSLQDLAKSDVAITKKKEKLLSVKGVPGVILNNKENPNGIASLLPYLRSGGNASWFWQMFNDHQRACQNDTGKYIDSEDVSTYGCTVPGENDVTLEAGKSIYHPDAAQQLFARTFQYGLFQYGLKSESAVSLCALHPENQTFKEDCGSEVTGLNTQYVENNCKSHMCVVDGFINTFNDISSGLNNVCKKRMENLTDLWEERNNDSSRLFDSTCSSGQGLNLGWVLQDIQEDHSEETALNFENQHNFSFLPVYETSTTILNMYIRCVEKQKLLDKTGDAHESGITFTEARDKWKKALLSDNCFTSKMVTTVGEDAATECTKYMDKCVAVGDIATKMGKPFDPSYDDLRDDMIRVLYCKSYGRRQVSTEWNCGRLDG
jgi:hypothetical protein